ncbi:MAG: hypothetical protein JO219_09015 [Candidatus Eremiobacteraeota bacterium]|nr:hypothetical protein [Candidatus Eremiobacteraeota bacterium]MBV8364966.1 hypothetical protein [Candidatus Eremiobacteraeota bacterium]
MDNYIAVVFPNDAKAYEGLHALWALDGKGDATVHAAAVIHRDQFGKIDVATKDTDIGVRTAVGVGVGALLGALAGPAGIATGATIGAAAGVGAATGGVIGLTADAVKSGEQEEASFETGFVLNKGQAAVLAEVSEDWRTPVDTTMSGLGGRVFRRAKSDVRDNALFGSDYDYYMYPYDYDPYFA